MNGKRKRGELSRVFPIVVACLITLVAGIVAERGLERHERIRGPKLASLGDFLPNDEVYRHDYDFTTDWFTDKLPVWEEVFTPYQGHPHLTYLEVGHFEGRSLLWMLEHVLTHPTAHATAIDPVTGAERDRFLANLDLSGLGEKVTLIVGLSQQEMRSLPVRSFDFIYIDGSHHAADVLEDAIVSAPLLKAGGLLIFDDYLLQLDLVDRPLLALNTFYRFYGKQYDVIHSGYQLILKARAE